MPGMLRCSRRVSRYAPAVGLALALLAGGAGALRAQGFGIAAGANFADRHDIDVGSAKATFNNSTGYHVGIEFEVGAGPFALRPGVFYQRMGSYDFPSGEEFKLSAVEVPVDVRLTVLPLPVVSPYVVAGPVLTFPQATGAFGDAVKSMSLTADIGAGVKISLPGGGLVLMPELRYSAGVTDYLKDSFQIGGATIQPSSSSKRLAHVMLRLHVFF
jgi:hypothetical protein